MKKRYSSLCGGLIFVVLLFLAAGCGGGGGSNPFGVESELVTKATGPAALAFAPDGRLFYTEQVTGNVRVVNPDGQLQDDPFAEVEVAVYIQWGLTGIALDPDFETNPYVYVFFTEPVDTDPPIGRPVVMRFTERNNEGVDREVIVDDLPETDTDHPGINANGGIHFGPDGFLYFTVGDYDLGPMVRFPQDLGKAQGKMFRVDKEDGSASPDNPFTEEPDADPRVFAFGFSRAFDFTFHPETGQAYGTGGTASCEELNLIEAGGNYGWPDVGPFPFSDCFAGEQIPAIHFFSREGFEPGDFTSATDTTGMEFVSGDVYPLLGDGLLVCESGTNLMRRLVLTGPNFDQVAADEEGVDNIVVEDCVGDIAVSPDGIIYYVSTEEEIRRLAPIEIEPE